MSAGVCPQSSSFLLSIRLGLIFVVESASSTESHLLAVGEVKTLFHGMDVCSCLESI